MTIRQAKPWRPDWAVHPGETLRETLAGLGLNGTTVAARLGVSQSYISDILNGRRGISPRVALGLETLGGPPAEFWVSLQGHYDLQIERLRKR